MSDDETRSVVLRFAESDAAREAARQPRPHRPDRHERRHPRRPVVRDRPRRRSHADPARLREPLRRGARGVGGGLRRRPHGRGRRLVHRPRSRRRDVRSVRGRELAFPLQRDARTTGDGLPRDVAEGDPRTRGRLRRRDGARSGRRAELPPPQGGRDRLARPVDPLGVHPARQPPRLFSQYRHVRPLEGARLPEAPVDDAMASLRALGLCPGGRRGASFSPLTVPWGRFVLAAGAAAIPLGRGGGCDPHAGLSPPSGW